MLFKTFLESRINLNNLIVVDIQPEYSNYINFSILEFCDYIIKVLKSKRKILYFYNGETIGSNDHPNSITEWLLEHYGDFENFEYYYNLILNNCEFVDKGYGIASANINFTKNCKNLQN